MSDKNDLAYITQEVCSIIETYHGMIIDPASGRELNELLKNLSANLYYLESIRSLYSRKHEQIMNDMYNLGHNGNKASNTANVEVPELFFLNKTMSAAYKTQESIRTNISFLKFELSTGLS